MTNPLIGVRIYANVIVNLEAEKVPQHVIDEFTEQTEFYTTAELVGMASWKHDR